MVADYYGCRQFSNLIANFFGPLLRGDIFQPPSVDFISIITLHSYMLQIHGGPLCVASMYYCMHLCFDFLWVLIHAQI